MPEMYIPHLLFYLLVAGGVLGWVLALRSALQVGKNSGKIELLEDVVHERDSEIRRLADVIEREVERTMFLLTQNQNFAQSLATLRVERGAVPDETSFDIPPDPPPPYSEELESFLSKMVHAESRRLLEEDIEYHRGLGKSDEQILQIIRSM